MKSVYFAICLVLSFIASPFASKSQTVEGVIKDSENIAIPYASMCWSNSSKGICCDSIGRYTLNTADFKANIDTIVISSIGYETVKLTADKFLSNKNIILSKRQYDIAEVVVKPQQIKEEEFGYASFSTSMLKLSGNPGSGVFVRIENTKKTPTYIRKIVLNLNGAGKKNAYKLRIRVLPFNALNNNAVDLLTEPLIIKCNKNKMVVDVQKYKLVFDEDGITIAVEWVSEKGAIIQKGDINYPCIRCTGKSDAVNTYIYRASEGKFEPLIVPDDVPTWILGRIQNACIGIVVR